MLLPMTNVNFGLTASDYATHRAGFPDSFFERLAARGTLRGGLRVVDLGTGTGTVARGFALRGCRVTALDRAEPMMREAARLDAGAGVRVDYRVAPRSAPACRRRGPTSSAPDSAGTGSTARSRWPRRRVCCAGAACWSSRTSTGCR